MKPETTFRKYLITGLGKLCHVVALENYAMPGTPDINGCHEGKEFWIECKCIEELPKRSQTTIKIRHFTKEQLLWLRKRHKNKGRVFVFLKVLNTRSYYLLDYSAAAILQKKEMTKNDLRRATIYRINRSVGFKALLNQLTER